MNAAAGERPLRFITIRFSHYCEKARWALDRAGLPYREETHVPIFSSRASIRAGGRRTVPCLVTASGVQADSTDILRWVDRQGRAPALLPQYGEAGEAEEIARLEEDFDRRLGPATRRLGYFHLLERRDLLRGLLVSAGRGWEARLGGILFPVLRSLIVRGLKVNAAGAERSRRVVDETFAAVEARLADGRPYLCGDRFTAADLTFASLATPVLLPDAMAPLFPLGERNDSPLWNLVDSYRARPAGRFALRLYEKDRGPLTAVQAA
jgi:glutathione S-transferase